MGQSKQKAIPPVEKNDSIGVIIHLLTLQLSPFQSLISSFAYNVVVKIVSITIAIIVGF